MTTEKETNGSRKQFPPVPVSEIASPIEPEHLHTICRRMRTANVRVFRTGRMEICLRQKTSKRFRDRYIPRSAFELAFLVPRTRHPMMIALASAETIEGSLFFRTECTDDLLAALKHGVKLRVRLRSLLDHGKKKSVWTLPVTEVNG